MALHIIRGSDREFTIRVTIESSCDSGAPFDLSSATEIKALFSNADGSVLTVTMTGGQIVILNGCAGKIKVSLTDLQTALLNVGEAQSFELEIHIGTVISIVQFVGSITIIDRIFP